MTTASERELRALSDLCLRSKAVWSYDEAFLEACRDILRVTTEDLQDPCAVIKRDGAFLGFVHVSVEGDQAQLEKLFVDPTVLGRGLGKALLTWAANAARAAGAQRMVIESDPGARPFYKGMGAKHIGSAPSEAVPGRLLPLMALDL
ncbi:MAG: GNAT family N-acetyltransferase [Paracoccaceae bacterium]|nr:GNAT family N-acetyltransferase [Paracoccaceae bacterium]